MLCVIVLASNSISGSFSELVYSYTLDDIYDVIPTVSINQTGPYVVMFCSSVS